MIKTTANRRKVMLAVLALALAAAGLQVSGAREPLSPQSPGDTEIPIQNSIPSDLIAGWMRRPLIPNPQSPTPHHFWDKQNTALILAGAGLRAADVYTTRRFLQLGGRERIMPERLVRNTPAFAAYSAGAAAGVAGLAWLAHRKDHHRIERAALWLHAGFMAGLVTNNFLYIRRLEHP